MKKVLYITNPVAGKMKNHSAMFDIVNEFCAADYDVTARITRYRGHAAELAQEAAEKGYDIVTCCGGDGTMNEVVTGVLRSGIRIPIGYIPAGSTNDFADNLGLSTVPAEAARAIAREEASSLDIGFFNEEYYFCYVASFGAFTDASYGASQEMKNTLGSLAYKIEAVKNLHNIKPYELKLTADDGREFSGKYIFGAVSNTKRMAGFFRLPVTTEELSDGVFEVLLVRYPKDVLDLNEILVGAGTEQFEGNRMFDYFRASRVEIDFSEDVDWSLDGEKRYGGNHTIIENLSRTITLYK